MKRIIMFMLTAAATEAGASSTNATNLTVVKLEPTSGKLTQLQAELATKAALIGTFPVMSKEWNDAMLDVFKQQKLIEAEKTAIVSAENAAKLQAARDAKIALVTEFETATLANATVQSGKGTVDVKQASADALTVLRDKLTNEIMGSLKASPAKQTSTGDSSAGNEKGATSKRIRGYFDEIRANNPAATQTEIVKTIIEKGESRGTTGAVVLAYMKELGEK